MEIHQIKGPGIYFCKENILKIEFLDSAEEDEPQEKGSPEKQKVQPVTAFNKDVSQASKKMTLNVLNFMFRQK
mgnify:CR=1 FL=1